VRDEPRNPFEAIAFPELMRQFGDLLSVRAEVGDYEYGLVAAILSEVFLGQLDAAERERFDRTVRAAHYYLDHGALKRVRESCEAYVRVVDAIPDALNDVIRKRGEAEAMLGDKWIEALLALYKSITEGLLTLLAAPVIVGFTHVYGGIKDPAFTPKPDGRVDLKAIELMENWSLVPSNLLKEGLNKHVRNAYAHQRYRILDDGVVEMWDEDRRGKVTWGPESWRFEAVEALCDRLLATCQAITLALAIFGINYRRLIRDRGYRPANLPKRVMRFEDIQRLIQMYAAFNSFTVVAIERRGEELHMKLKTQSRGIDQSERIMVGGPAGSRSYEKPVRYEQSLVGEIALGLLQRALGGEPGYARYVLEIANEDDVAMGTFAITSAALGSVQGPKGGNVAKDRQLAEVDSLGEAQMWVKIEEPPEPLLPGGRRGRGRVVTRPVR
jgi:hypothetical protein